MKLTHTISIAEDIRACRKEWREPREVSPSLFWLLLDAKTTVNLHPSRLSGRVNYSWNRLCSTVLDARLEVDDANRYGSEWVRVLALAIAQPVATDVNCFSISSVANSWHRHFAISSPSLSQPLGELHLFIPRLWKLFGNTRLLGRSRQRQLYLARNVQEAQT